MTGYHSGEMPKYQKHYMALWCINVSLCGSFIKVSLCCPFKQDVKFAMFLFMCQIAFFPSCIYLTIFPDMDQAVVN